MNSSLVTSRRSHRAGVPERSRLRPAGGARVRPTLSEVLSDALSEVLAEVLAEVPASPRALG